MESEEEFFTSPQPQIPTNQTSLQSSESKKFFYVHILHAVWVKWAVRAVASPSSLAHVWSPIVLLSFVISYYLHCLWAGVWLKENIPSHPHLMVPRVCGSPPAPENLSPTLQKSLILLLLVSDKSRNKNYLILILYILMFEKLQSVQWIPIH